MHLFPDSLITTAVDQTICPFSYSYYVKNTGGSWVLQPSNSDLFTAFSISTGKLTVFTSNHALASTYSIKWKIEDPYSTSSARFVEEIR